MNQCKNCRSYAINLDKHGRDGSEPDLCDVCYWRTKAEALKATVERVRGALKSLAAVSRRYLPDYDEHPEIQRADAALAGEG